MRLDPVVERRIGVDDKADVLLHASGADAALSTSLGAAEPGSGTSIHGPHVQLVALANNPHCHRIAQAAIAPL